MKKFLFALLGLVLVGGTATPGKAGIIYTAPVDDTAGSTVFTQLFGINDSGTVVGVYQSPVGAQNDNAFSSSGSYTSFPSVNCPTSTCTGADAWEAPGINNSGLIVGTYFTRAEFINGYLDNGGTFSTFDVTSSNCPSCGPSTGIGAGTFLQAVNASGEIVGIYTTSSGTQGFTLSSFPSGTVTPIAISGSTASTAIAVNNSGTVAGSICLDGACLLGTPPNQTQNPDQYGYTLSGSTVTCYSAGSAGSVAGCSSWVTFGISGAITTNINGIDAAGDIVGTYTVSGVDYGFIYSGGVVTSLGPGMVNSGSTSVKVLGINSSGTGIVGSYVSSSDTNGFVGAITQSSQTINFGTLSNMQMGSAPFPVSATATSGSPVSFNSQTMSICTVSGNTVTLVTVGTCTIQATQAGNIFYSAASPVSQSFQVTAGTASSMSANAGTTPQSATINTAFANALAVTVKDGFNDPVSGVNVTFTAPGSGASGLFSNSTATITVATNASGIASAAFTANATAGGPYNVTAAASGLTSVNFSLTNTVGAPSTMTSNSGTTPQSTAINTAFANALAVTVKDAGSNPVSGVNVTFTAPGSGASGLFSNSTATIVVATNASGIASAAFTANATAGGPYNVTAAATGLTTVNFSLTNTVGVPSTMTSNSGTTPQSTAINTAFANALAVTVKDAGSNPVSGVNVTFTAPGSGASGLFSNSTATIMVATNSSGIASAAFTANAAAGGPYNVTAAATGLTTVNFSLTNTGGGLSGPTLVSPANGAVDVSLTASLNWDTAAGATSYDVYFGTSSSPPFVVNQTATTYSPGTLATTTTYYWQIVARNGSGTAPSATWSFTSQGPALQFYPVAPCRLVDTRGASAGFNGNSPFSGPSIPGNGTITIPVQSAAEASANTMPAPCGVIPSSAQAYSFNLTVVPAAGGAVDYVSLWPAGSSQPFVSTLDDPQGLIVSNAAIVPAGSPSGGISVYNAGPSATDVILDMNGYFAPPGAGLEFYPVAPCRLVDTRGAAAGFNGISPFSGPPIPTMGTATIPVQSATEASTDTEPAPCGVIPSGAQAYSFNLTVVPMVSATAVDYVSLWPAASTQPFVSTLDDPQGAIVSNAAIVPAGSPSGGVSVYNDGPATTDVVIDMNGYFAAPTALQFYPVTPCRLVDTRGAAAGFNGISPFSGPSISGGGTITIPVQSATEASTDTEPAPCGVIPSVAQAYSLNITVVPEGATGVTAGGRVDYISLWPSGSSQPFVSTLDDPQGLIVSNAAIVPAGSPSGGISVYNGGPAATDVIIDMNGYFAPPAD